MIINTYKIYNFYWRNFKETRANENWKYIEGKKTLQIQSVLIQHFDSFTSHKNDKKEKDDYTLNSN